MGRKLIFRFEGEFKAKQGDMVSIFEWREVKTGLPYEAIKIKNLDSKKEFTSRTGGVEMLNPINGTVINGRIIGLKEKFNVKTQTPIFLFEIEIA